MEATRSYKTLASYHIITRSHNPEHHDLDINCLTMFLYSVRKQVLRIATWTEQA